MPVRFSCSCGKNLKVPDQHAGRRVKCPSCGKSLVVPQPGYSPEPAPQPAAPGIIEFSCACGQSMQAQTEYAGRPTKCPGCGQIVTIPQASTPGNPLDFRSQPSAPAAQETFAPGQPGAYDDDAQPGKPRRRKGAGVMAWMMLLSLLFLLGGMGVGMVYYFSSWGKVPPDLALVPADAPAFVSFRLADIWNNEKLRATFPPDMHKSISDLEVMTGISPTQVERVTVVFRDLPQARPAYFIVLTNKPFDGKDLADKMKLTQKREYAGGTYYRGAIPGEGALLLHAASDRVLIFAASEDDLLTCMERRPRWLNHGPLGKALRQATYRQFTAGVQIPPGVRAGASGDPRGDDPFAQAGPLIQHLRTVAVAGDLDSSGEVVLTLTYDTPGAASDAKSTIDTVKSMFLEQLPEEVKGFVNSVEIDQRGTEVVGRVSDIKPEKLEMLSNFVPAGPGF